MISRYKNRSSKSTGSNGSGVKYAVTLAVKNGPFETKTEAGKSASFLKSKGIKVDPVIKTAKGYVFTSKVSYGMANASIREKVVSTLKSHAKTSGLKQGTYRITTKNL